MRTQLQKQFILNCSKLNNKQVFMWLDLLFWLNSMSKSNFEIVLLNSNFDRSTINNKKLTLISDYTVDYKNNFVVLFDSKTLTQALLSCFDVVFLETQHEPEYINHTLFPLAKSGLPEYTHYFKSWEPMCTLLTSMFNGDEYKEEFLENTHSFIELHNIEVLIFRPNSMGKEHGDLLAFGLQNSSLVYAWLAKDPGLYDVWNLGIRMSSAPYCSNANIDDKRSPEHVVELVKGLEQNAKIDVGSTSLRVTDTKVQLWNESTNDNVWYLAEKSEIYSVEKLIKFNKKQQKIVSHNIPHCMPVWRSKLHRVNGYFTEIKYGPSSDWEFWLRCGTAGSQFYLLNKELGLHYRAPQSYWRRNPNAKDFDGKILNEYFKNDVARVQPLSQGIRSLKYGCIIDAFGKNDYWMGISFLYTQLQNHTPSSKVERELLAKICSSILEADLGYLVDAANKLSPVSKVRDTFFDFLGFYLRGLNEVRISNTLFSQLLMLADKVISAENKVLGWLIKAKTYQVNNENTFETLCLREAYQSNPYDFWCNVNRFYGLKERLPYFLTRLVEVPQISDLSWLTPGRTIYYLPDYTQGNPYQKLLYQNFEQFDVRVKGLSEAESLSLDISSFDSGDVLHIHWINILFENQTIDSIDAVLDKFLGQLRLLKQKSVKVVWTVHNRQNHQQLDLEIEYQFRKELSKLCDVVLLHHPIIEMELKAWLNKDANLQIIEHGLYINVYKNEISKNEARKRIGIDTEKLTITTLGKIKEYKDLANKLKVIRQAIRENNLQVTYVIAGKIFCKETLAEINDSETDSIIAVKKFIKDDDIQLYLNSADYVLLSYRDILTSGGFFQAMTFSKNVLAPDLGSLQYYVADGVNGYKYSSDEELSTILVSLKSHYRNVSIAENLVNWPVFTIEFGTHIQRRR